jgi:hypothetical protein
MHCRLIRSGQDTGCELECIVILYCYFYYRYRHYTVISTAIITGIPTIIVGIMGVAVKSSRFHSLSFCHSGFALKTKAILHYSVELSYMEPSGGHFHKCGVLMSSLWF